MARYGGNTACVEVRCGDHLLIFDGGTGLRALGNALLETSSAIDADIFFSHYHLDHICGLPFFAPCHVGTSRLRLWGGLLPTTSLRVTQSMMTEPFFPTAPDSFRASIDFRDFHAGDSLHPYAGVTLQTGPLNHPGNAIGYRLEHGDHSMAYITDTEHRPGKLDPNVLRLAAGARAVQRSLLNLMEKMDLRPPSAAA
jgi:phosphoribosyl 1,2-cyclic phosphodiesterase